MISLTKLALPLSLTFLGQVAIGTTDVMMIGRLGYRELGGASLAFNLYIVLFLLGTGIVIATTPLAAQAAGAKNERKLRETIQHSLYFALLLSAVGVLILDFISPILTLARQDSELIGFAAEYMHLMKWTMIPALAILPLRSLMSVLQRPLLAMWVMFIGVIVNGALDYILIFGHFGMPALGLQGAALASILVNTAMLLALILLHLNVKQLREIQLFKFQRPQLQLARRLLIIGVPISLALVMEEGLFSGAMLLMGLIGQEQVAAHQISIQIGNITYMSILGLADAATIRVGQAIGRGDYQGVRLRGYTAAGVATTLMLIFALIIWTHTSSISALFLDASVAENQPVIALAASFLTVLAIYQLVDGIQLTLIGALHGFPDTRIPMLFAAFGYWVIGFGLAIGLGFFTPLAGVGIWLAMATGLAVVAVLAFWRFEYLSQQLKHRQPQAAVSPC